MSWDWKLEKKGEQKYIQQKLLVCFGVAVEFNINEVLLNNVI